MRTLWLPPARHGVTPPRPPQPSAAALILSPFHFHRRTFSFNRSSNLPYSPPFLSSLSLSSLKALRSLSSNSTFLTSTHISLSNRITVLASAPTSTPYISPNDESDKDKLAQVSKRLQRTSRYFRRLGSLSFWGQLVCTVVAAVILSFSVVVTGKITSPVSFYATAGGIAAAFISVFCSFGYLRLANKLGRTANEPSKAPPRADVVKSLKNGIILNLLGMGAAILGMQATVGRLVAKALTTSSTPYYQGISPGSSPVLALDVFLVQASANTILSHFLGLVIYLELLHSITLPLSESIPVPKVA